MSARYEHVGRDDAFEDASDSPDREISLGTTTVLALFVGLALLCGAFFGFGYSMGRKSMLPTLGNVDTRVSASPSDAQDAPESASATPEPPLSTATPKQAYARSNAETAADDTTASPKPPPSTKPSAASSSTHEAPQRVVSSIGSDASAAQAPSSTTKALTSSAKAAASSGTASSVTPSSSTAATAIGQSYVQVAAISHKEDADLLLASLRRRGYTATIRQVPQDNLLHIQIGPIASKKDAETMRQRLLSDGYNAIVK